MRFSCLGFHYSNTISTMKDRSREEDAWISLKEAAALTQKPERTLRHQLSQGRIVGKKVGQSWAIDLTSLRQTGQIKIVEPLSPPTPPAISTRAQTGYREQTPAASQTDKRKTSPLQFGSYRAVFDFRKTLVALSDLSEFIKELDACLYDLASGYLEFSKTLKLNYYRSARCHLSRLWVNLQIYSENKGVVPEAVPLSDQILNELIPILSGALRKIEMSTPKNTDRKSGFMSP